MRPWTVSFLLLGIFAVSVQAQTPANLYQYADAATGAFFGRNRRAETDAGFYGGCRTVSRRAAG